MVKSEVPVISRGRAAVEADVSVGGAPVSVTRPPRRQFRPILGLLHLHCSPLNSTHQSSFVYHGYGDREEARASSPGASHLDASADVHHSHRPPAPPVRPAP